MSDYIDYGGDNFLCPNCLDDEMRCTEQPIWATDQSEVYGLACPTCGHSEHLVELWPLDDEDYLMAALDEQGILWLVGEIYQPLYDS